MLERLASQAFYCFLDGYSGYNQILVKLEDQLKKPSLAHLESLPIEECPLDFAMHQPHSKGV